MKLSLARLYSDSVYNYDRAPARVDSRALIYKRPGGFRVTLTPDIRQSIYNHTPRSFTNCFSWPLLTPREMAGKENHSVSALSNFKTV